MSDELDNITLADIENMINVLEKFIKISKRAERLVRQFGSGRYGMDADLFKMLLSGAVNTPIASGDSDNVELTEEELKTIEKVRSMRKKEKTD